MDGLTVTVRRQWNDYRLAVVQMVSLSNPHFSQFSGGVGARSPRPFLHAYVSCDEVVEGELSHSCRHGRGPHCIKVCITKKDNSREVYEQLLAMVAS